MTMTCEDFELELGAPALSALARAHLEGCASCRETCEVVALAALPEVAAAERAALVGLSTSALSAWRAQDRRRDVLSRVASLALAAGLGAVLATGVMWKARPAAVAEVPALVQPVAAPVLLEPVVPDFSDDAFDSGDDEVSWEVSWPLVTEGDL
ncbi:MAG: hypothetical protein AMXMBFR34_22580 [Myxococcaceae bacterium]